MKRFGILLLSVVLLGTTACTTKNAADAVEMYLNEYKTLSDNVLEDIDTVTKSEELKEELNETYKDILKRGYRDLEYTIENEAYDGNTADVTVKITVYDLYAASLNARNYLEENAEEFLTNGSYDSDKYIAYKLNKMKNTNERISYTIVLTCVKIDSTWQVEEPNEMTLEKIHGIYNYDAK